MESQTIEIARDALRSAPSGVYVQNVPKEEAKIFYSEGKHGVADSLEVCSNEGYQALFMPELAKARIGSQELWKNWFLTPSLRVTGKTKQGTKVIVYAHQPNYFSDPVNIRNIVESEKLVNGAGPIPQEEFNRLEALNGNGRVFVIPYETLKQSSLGVISADDALDHPQTIPFLGGEEIAKAYLVRHKEVYGDNIGIWHCDDFDKLTPRGRLLYVGDYNYGLSGSIDLSNVGRCLGIAPEAPVAQNLESRI